MIKDTSSQDVILEKPHLLKRWLRVESIIVLIVTIGVSLFLVFSNWISTDRTVDSSRVRVAVVEKGAFIRDISLQGSIVAANSPKLYAPAIGTVSLFKNPGELVNKGDRLAEVDSPALTNRLQQERAKLESLRIAFERQKIATKQARIKNQVPEPRSASAYVHFQPAW